MATRGKSINLFLMDGSPTGRIKVTLANWTGVAYKIPRTELDKCKGRDDLSQSGVYFLFGTIDPTGESVVYIGQAGVRKNGEGLLCRLQEHKRNIDKDYWTEAVVFTTSNNSFGPTEISYLENRFTNMAVSAKRYLVKNGNDPSAGNITEEKESELEEFIEYAIIVMGTLGHKVFEPLSQAVITSGSTGTNMFLDPQVFIINRSGANAKCRVTAEGIVVLAGSKIRLSTVPSCPEYVKDFRTEHKDHIDEYGNLREDILFKTPSGASAFVLGAPSNGNVEWKTAEGISLKEYETRGATADTTLGV
ncbi:MAG: GIY-YIG nuclease family protein [Christensenellales bacterium]